MESKTELDLHDFSKKCTDIKFRSEPHDKEILEILSILIEKLKSEPSVAELGVILNCLRCLRNIVAGVKHHQTFLAKSIFGLGKP